MTVAVPIQGGGLVSILNAIVVRVKVDVVHDAVAVGIQGAHRSEVDAVHQVCRRPASVGLKGETRVALAGRDQVGTGVGVPNRIGRIRIINDVHVARVRGGDGVDLEVHPVHRPTSFGVLIGPDHDVPRGGFKILVQGCDGLGVDFGVLVPLVGVTRPTVTRVPVPDFDGLSGLGRVPSRNGVGRLLAVAVGGDVGRFEATVHQIVGIGVGRVALQRPKNAVPVLVRIPPVGCPVIVGVFFGQRVGANHQFVAVKQPVIVGVGVEWGCAVR